MCIKIHFVIYRNSKTVNSIYISFYFCKKIKTIKIMERSNLEIKIEMKFNVQKLMKYIWYIHIFVSIMQDIKDLFS